MESPSRKDQFINYPSPVQGPKTTYKYTPGINPVLSGLPLTIASSLVTNISPLAGLFWSNAGFGVLRKLDILNNYEPRCDPTVIPIGDEDHSTIDTPAIHHAGNHQSGILNYGAAYRSDATTPRDVVEALLRLIGKDASKRHEFVSINEEEVIAAADASTQRHREGRPIGPLDGIPVAIKDEVHLRGHPQKLGSAHDFRKAQQDTAWCVRKWQEAGAIVTGKLNMHELGLDTSGNNPITGTPPNPQNPDFYPGGSSSASATTVARGLLPLTLGCDGGGSIRIPSTYCGIYGLKPTHNRVGRSPATNIASSTSVIGPMARCMADLELGYRVMAAPDVEAKGASAMFAPPGPISKPRGNGGRKKRVLGICRPWFDCADPPVLNLCHAALSHFESSGDYEIIDIDLPLLHEGQLAHALTILTEILPSASNSPQRFSAPTSLTLSVGAQSRALDFLLAQKLRNLLMQHLSYLFHAHPGLLLVTPTTPNAGWEIGEMVRGGLSDANMSVRSMTYVWLANFVGCPAVSIPVGKTVGEGAGLGGVPVGLMAMGEWGDEGGLFKWGRRGEEHLRGEEGGEMGRPADWVDVVEVAKGLREE